MPSIPPSCAQTFTTLHNFSALSYATNSDGANPHCSLVLSGRTLYGTAYNGGYSGYGTVFSVETNGASFGLLYSFGNTDGAGPLAGLVLSGDVLYGTTESGGPSIGGTVFSLNTNKVDFNIVHFFIGDDGAGVAAPVYLSSGTLYGTTYTGTAAGDGTVFSVTTNGSSFSSLHAFSGTDGVSPSAPLVLSGSTLYGTAADGGSSGNGTVFALDTTTTNLVVLHTFTASPNNTNGDGAHPYGALVLSGNALYGTASHGGAFGYGTVFRINTNGTAFSLLHSFSGYPDDGSYPETGLLLAGGTLYGTAKSGGLWRGGTVFALKTDGTDYHTLYTFTALANNTNSDGASPQGGLILSANWLYGTTYSGGSSGNGTVFSLFVRPRLAIRLAGSNVILTWPTNAVGFTLQSSTNSAPASTWANVSPMPSIVDGENTVTNAASATSAFYRLAH